MLAPLENCRFNENFLFNLYYAVLSMQGSSSDIISVSVFVSFFSTFVSLHRHWIFAIKRLPHYFIAAYASHQSPLCYIFF